MEQGCQSALFTSKQDAAHKLFVAIPWCKERDITCSACEYSDKECEEN